MAARLPIRPLIPTAEKQATLERRLDELSNESLPMSLEGFPMLTWSVWCP